jgi:nicotinate-nucleotide adenylyltransferase
MAKAAIQTLALDKLVIMPASTPPHKQGKRLSPAELRLQACKLAFENEPKVEVSDYEIRKGIVSRCAHHPFGS